MHMLEEILSQPAGVKRTIEGNRERAQQVAQAIKDRGGVDFVLIVGRGTSDNAATYAKYIFGLVNGLPVALAAPSLMNLYESPLRLDRALVISVSQSGETDEVISATDFAKAKGAFCLGITNEENSTLAGLADAALFCLTGREQSIPATKTYTGELAALALLSFTMAGDDRYLKELEAIPGLLEKTIDKLDPIIAGRAERYRFMRRCLVLGRGLNFATALEAALKLKETCAVGAEALSAADFLHGPIAALKPGFPVIVFAPDDPTMPALQAMLERIKQFHCETLIISNDRDLLDEATLGLEVPSAPSPLCWPILAIVPIQLLAYRLAVVKGMDPDHPVGLSKVTHTG